MIIEDFIYYLLIYDTNILQQNLMAMLLSKLDLIFISDFHNLFQRQTMQYQPQTYNVENLHQNQDVQSDAEQEILHDPQNLNDLLDQLNLSLIKEAEQLSQISRDELFQMLRDIDCEFQSDLVRLKDPNLPQDKREIIQKNIWKMVGKVLQKRNKQIEQQFNQIHFQKEQLLKQLEKLEKPSFELKLPLREHRIQNPYFFEELKKTSLLQLLQSEQVLTELKIFETYNQIRNSKPLSEFKDLYHRQTDSAQNKFLSDMKLSVQKTTKVPNNFLENIEKCQKATKQTFQKKIGPTIIICGLKSGVDILFRKKNIKQTIKENAKQSSLNLTGQIVGSAVASFMPKFGTHVGEVISQLIPLVCQKQNATKIKSACKRKFRRNRDQKCQNFQK